MSYHTGCVFAGGKGLLHSPQTGLGTPLMVTKLRGILQSSECLNLRPGHERSLTYMFFSMTISLLNEVHFPECVFNWATLSLSDSTNPSISFLSPDYFEFDRANVNTALENCYKLFRWQQENDSCFLSLSKYGSMLGNGSLMCHPQFKGLGTRRCPRVF